MAIANNRTPVTHGGQAVQVVALDWANGQLIAVGAASAASAVFDANNDCSVELCCDTDTWYTVGEDPTALLAGAGSQFVPSGSTRYVYVPADQKIAVIQATAGGHAAMIPALHLD